MRKLDVATIGPPEYCKFCGKLLKPKPLAIAIIFTRNHSFLGGGVCSGVGVLLLSEGRAGNAMPCRRPRRSSWRDGHGRPAIHPETYPPGVESIDIHI